VSLYGDTVGVLTRWQPPSAEQAGLRSSYLAHLEAHPDGLSKACHPDHLTASLLVVSEDREQVLLNLHRKYAIWVQFGGHCEPEDATFEAAALREGEEESGISGLRLVGDGPVQLSRHEVRCGPLRPSHHLDVRYVAVAPPGARPVPSSESIDVQWFGRDALPVDLEPELRTLVALATQA
jgi:8-oxo-dGTP pyrophosphatase MutT (NUDIX family)